MNCKRCAPSDGNYCLECKTGFYDNECGSSCAPNCEGCRKRDGRCNSCVNGYWGKYCNNKCGDRCKTCNRSKGCTECNNGYYGSKCEKNCSDYCASCDIQNGCTACTPGYYSDDGVCKHCQNKNTGCTCTSYYNCVGCTNGYFLNTDNCLHCPHYCTSCISSTQCTSCMEGRFGNTCQHQCTGDCDNGNCDSSKATCQCNANYVGEKCNQCVAGYYGNGCKQRCSVGCSGSCNQIDGSCTCKSVWQGDTCDTCADKHYGNMCNKQCISNCVSCTDTFKCQICIAGHYGSFCQLRCGKGCINDTCDITSGYCQCKSTNFIPKHSTTFCDICVAGKFGQTCELRCPPKCTTCENETRCDLCHDGFHGIFCQKHCPDGCFGNTCKKEDGSCFTCKSGYFGKHCNNNCPELCKSCDQYNSCLECKSGYSNIQKLCSCRRDVCVNSVDCDSCTNTSYFASKNECCLCNLDDCVSCTKTFGTIHCNIYRGGYFQHKHGKCEACNSQCVENECDSSSGRCIQGCINGYWNPTCDKKCKQECLSCNQADGSCLQCINTTKYGHDCNKDCSNTCKSSICDISGKCTNGCITNTFGKQCENTCDKHCIKQDKNTLCSEKTGMCLYGCETGYEGTFCPQDDEKQTSATTLGGAVGGGVVALSVIVVLGLYLLRRRRSNSNNTNTTPKQESEDSSLYATMNKENADDVCARGFTVMPALENNGVYYNEREISKVKLDVANLPEYVQNLCIKDLEEEFQKVPSGLVKPYEVSQMKLNMHRNRYKGIYPYDDTRVVVRGGDTDYINASYIDGFRKRNAYIATLGPMAQQLGDFGQFWRMVWQQKVEKIVMVTNLVEGQKSKCQQYWPDRGQSKLYGDMEVMCKVEKLYADFIWRQFTFSKVKQNSEKRILHHLQFTAWPDKDIPDNVTSIIEFRQKVNALPSSFDGPVIVHCRWGVK
ncbi:LAR-like protein, partial [Mya arenaria]